MQTKRKHTARASSSKRKHIARDSSSKRNLTRKQKRYTQSGGNTGLSAGAIKILFYVPGTITHEPPQTPKPRRSVTSIFSKTPKKTVEKIEENPINSESLIHELFSHNGTYSWCSGNQNTISKEPLDMIVPYPYPYYVFDIIKNNKVTINKYTIANAPKEIINIAPTDDTKFATYILNYDTLITHTRRGIGRQKTTNGYYGILELPGEHKIYNDYYDNTTLETKQSGGRGPEAFKKTVIAMDEKQKNNKSVFDELFSIKDGELIGYICKAVYSDGKTPVSLYTFSKQDNAVVIDKYFITYCHTKIYGQDEIEPKLLEHDTLISAIAGKNDKLQLNMEWKFNPTVRRDSVAATPSARASVATPSFQTRVAANPRPSTAANPRPSTAANPRPSTAAPRDSVVPPPIPTPSNSVPAATHSNSVPAATPSKSGKSGKRRQLPQIPPKK
jgi:hypothetical protein